MPSLTTPTIKAELQRQRTIPSPEHRWLSENVVTAYSFAIVLAALFLITFSQLFSAQMVLDENRSAAKFPKLESTWQSVHSFPNSFEHFFNDRFAFRHAFVHSRALVCLNLFHISAHPHVLRGKNGFFFFANDENLPLILKAWPFTPDQMNVWKTVLERRHYWCKERGIDYYFILAPTKPSIYPEFLPNEYANPATATHTDELIAFLKQTHSPVKVIDLRSALLSHKGSLPLFLKTDTHWNELGSYYAYRSLIQQLQAHYPSMGSPKELSEFPMLAYWFNNGDLARMQGLYGWLKEANITLARGKPLQASIFKDPKWAENQLGMEATRPLGYRQNNSHQPRAVMFRDSFACAWSTIFLPDHFSSISFFWQRAFSKPVVLREKPDIVLQEEIEACLYLSPPDDL